MKFYKLCVLAVVALCSSLSFTSCSTDEESSGSNLQGWWFTPIEKSECQFYDPSFHGGMDIPYTVKERYALKFINDNTVVFYGKVIKNGRCGYHSNDYKIHLVDNWYADHEYLYSYVVEANKVIITVNNSVSIYTIIDNKLVSNGGSISDAYTKGYTEDLDDLPSTSIVECRECWGDGECKTCDGTGACDDPNCKGRGYYYCGWCEGDGKCYVCDGVGRYRLPLSGWNDCKTCGGSGDCVSCEGYGGPFECENCHWSGKCSTCQGTAECQECEGLGHLTYEF